MERGRAYTPEEQHRKALLIQKIREAARKKERAQLQVREQAKHEATRDAIRKPVEVIKNVTEKFAPARPYIPDMPDTIIDPKYTKFKITEKEEALAKSLDSDQRLSHKVLRALKLRKPEPEYNTADAWKAQAKKMLRVPERPAKDSRGFNAGLIDMVTVGTLPTIEAAAKTIYKLPDRPSLVEWDDKDVSVKRQPLGQYLAGIYKDEKLRSKIGKWIQDSKEAAPANALLGGIAGAAGLGAAFPALGAVKPALAIGGLSGVGKAEEVKDIPLEVAKESALAYGGAKVVPSLLRAYRYAGAPALAKAAKSFQKDLAAHGLTPEGVAREANTHPLKMAADVHDSTRAALRELSVESPDLAKRARGFVDRREFGEDYTGGAIVRPDGMRGSLAAIKKIDDKTILSKLRELEQKTPAERIAKQGWYDMENELKDRAVGPSNFGDSARDPKPFFNRGEEMLKKALSGSSPPRPLSTDFDINMLERAGALQGLSDRIKASSDPTSIANAFKSQKARDFLKTIMPENKNAKPYKEFLDFVEDEKSMHDMWRQLDAKVHLDRFGTTTKDSNNALNTAAALGNLKAGLSVHIFRNNPIANKYRRTVADHYGDALMSKDPDKWLDSFKARAGRRDSSLRVPGALAGASVLGNPGYGKDRTGLDSFLNRYWLGKRAVQLGMMAPASVPLRIGAGWAVKAPAGYRAVKGALKKALKSSPVARDAAQFSTPLEATAAMRLADQLKKRKAARTAIKTGTKVAF